MHWLCPMTSAPQRSITWLCSEEASCPVSWNEQSEASEEIRNMTNTYCLLINQEMAFLGKKPGIQRKKVCQLKIVCLSRSISIGTFLCIRMMGRRRFASVYSTSTSSFLRSGSQNGFVAYTRFTLNNSAAKTKILDFVHALQGLFLELEGRSCLHLFMATDNTSTNILTSCYREKKNPIMLWFKSNIYLKWSNKIK